MGPLGTRNIENRPMNKKSAPDIDNSSSLHDECNNTATEDEHFGDTFPYEDNDAFDTQVMDFDNETQPVDLCEDTQILYLAGETQVMDELDEFDLDEYMDTQLLDLSYNETNCENDEQGAERPRLLHDSKEFLGRNDNEIGAGEEKGIHTCHHDDRGAKTETLLPDDPVQSLGSLRKGFTAVRTASLRAAALAAQRKVSKDSDHGSCSTEFSSRSSNLKCLGYHGTSDIRTVNLEYDTKPDDGKGLSNGFKNKVARSLAKELFMEEDVTAEEGFNNSRGGEMTSLSQLPACNNEVAGLSYVDSQEPGELSQANALEFVDRFLKINVLESEDMTNRSAVAEINPETIGKGPQSLAQQANIRSSLTGASVFDWDDNREDEGGGEFFTKKKEVLFGKQPFLSDVQGPNGSHHGPNGNQSCMKPRNSQHHGPNGSQSLGKLKNEKEHHNKYDKKRGLQSDSKLVKSSKTGQLEEINRRGNNYPDVQGDLPSCDGELLAAAHNAESTSMPDVGIDTQTAAEVLEALSTENVLVTNNDGAGDEDNQNVIRKQAAKNTLSKQSSVEKQPFLSRSGTTKPKRTNRATMKSGDKSKSTVASRTRSQYTVKDFNIEVVKPKVKSRRLCMEKISTVKEKETSDGLVNIDGKGTLCALDGQLKKIVLLPLERQKPQDEACVSAPVARKTRQLTFVNHVSGAHNEFGDSRGQRRSLDAVQSDTGKTKGISRSDVDPDNLSAREETSDITGMAGNAKNDRSSSGKTLRHASNQVNGSGTNQSQFGASGGHEVLSQSISRRTRSKRSARCAEFPRDGKVLRSGMVISSEDACQSSSKKHKTCSSPAEGAGPPTELEGSPIHVQNSSIPVNITPVNLKAATSEASPLCVGDGYSTPPSCKKKRSLSREFYRLTASEPKYTSPSKDLRQRRDFNNVRVLFSQHLDDDVIRKQKKILSRLGVPVAASISEATHFVADVFVRTRNMLEAIACGKPVVTHLWLESCGQSNCYTDEKNYILRDAKKEKELGFSMPNSLARASHYPLLQGRRVLITPNVKPSKEIISGLVKAVHGQATERLCRSSDNNRLPDDLLVLSCEEDFQECLPLLEKGIAVYSSELLLNGIITQKLEYERYRIFVDHVKRTRSTLWIKKKGDKYLPVTATK